MTQYNDFCQSRVLITSYESLRLHVNRLSGCPIDLVICDEAHRENKKKMSLETLPIVIVMSLERHFSGLKNDRTKTAVAICQLPTSRRLLLSGTPIQVNDHSK